MFLQEHWTCFAHQFTTLHSTSSLLCNANRIMRRVLWFLLTTSYGTRNRCCQTEGRRGEDYDRHQPGRILCGCRSKHTADRLRSAIECHQRPWICEGS